MALHYDPAYDRARKKRDRASLGRVALSPTDPASQEEACDTIVRAIGALDAQGVGRDA